MSEEELIENLSTSIEAIIHRDAQKRLEVRLTKECALKLYELGSAIKNGEFSIYGVLDEQPIFSKVLNILINHKFPNTTYFTMIAVYLIKRFS